MKEGIPKEIDGVDVTNIPPENQREYVDSLIEADEHLDLLEASDVSEEEAKTLMGISQHFALRTLGALGLGSLGTGILGQDIQEKILDENEYNKTVGLQEEALSHARSLVDQNPNIEVARQEMDRDLAYRQGREDVRNEEIESSLQKIIGRTPSSDEIQAMNVLFERDVEKEWLRFVQKMKRGEVAKQDIDAFLASTEAS